MDINKLAHDCHETAVEKGWWIEGQKRDDAELICLFHSEVSEVFEEYRKGKGLDEVYYNEDSLKPEGIPIEFADLLIRILDYCGANKIYKLNWGEVGFAKQITLPEFCAYLHQSISDMFPIITPYFLGKIIDSVLEFCEIKKINIEERIQLKMTYNKTRPHRHGNKKA